MYMHSKTMPWAYEISIKNPDSSIEDPEIIFQFFATVVSISG